MPWYAKALALGVAAYAFSPIDLIPDFIPVVGYLDDLIVVPLGIALVIRMIPRAVWEECTRAAQEREQHGHRRLAMVAGIAVVLVWLAALAWVAHGLTGAWR